MTTTIETTPATPTIPEDQLGELLFEFIHSSTPTDKILSERGIKITTFLHWLTTTRAREIFRALEDLVQLRAKVLTANNALRAIIALGAVVSTPDIQSPRHAETIRKAATTLMNAQRQQATPTKHTASSPRPVPFLSPSSSPPSSAPSSPAHASSTPPTPTNAPTPPAPPPLDPVLPLSTFPHPLAHLHIPTFSNLPTPTIPRYKPSVHASP